MSRPSGTAAARRRVGAGVVALALLLSATPVAAEGGRAGDFDDDGRDDLAVGVPDEAVGAVNDAGAVNVLYGSSAGTTASGDLLFTQSTLGGTVEELDRLGNALAYGDFDGDGFDDLAVGAPTEDWQGAADAGVVHIVYGSAAGLNVSDRQVISQAGAMAGANEPGDFFGADLAAGDFDDDGFVDLAVAIPGEDSGGAIAAGAVLIAYGSSGGITTAGSRILGQAGSVPGTPEDFDAFGSAITVGNFNGDAYDDVAVGVPGEDIGSDADAGAAHVFYGSNSGIAGNGAVFSQSGPVPGTPEPGDRFGYDLAAGDVDADGRDDLIVGAPGEGIGGIAEAGAIHVLYGTNSGISASGSDAFNQKGAIPGVNETGDQFGTALAAGDFNNDGDDDIAVGVPFENIGSRADAGSITIIGGNPNGATTAGSFALTQSNLPSSSAESGDRMGTRLRVGDFDGDGFDDLVVAAPFENIGAVVDAGAVQVIYGSSGSLDAASADAFHQDTPGVEGGVEANDRFGAGL